MILCLDVGNSQIYGGVFIDGEIKLRFRRSSKEAMSSDELGMFLKGVLRENLLDPENIEKVAICSVVPSIDHSLSSACLKYLKRKPFILMAGRRTGLRIRYRNPIEVGADRIANAIGAVQLYPNRDLVIADFGTATTLCAITRNRDYEGGAIMPGLRLSMEALESKTSKLPAVAIVAPERAVGRSTVECIQAGLFFGQLGMVKELISRMTKECFGGEKPFVIGTGGFSSLFDKESIFDIVMPDLVLRGLYFALEMND